MIGLAATVIGCQRNVTEEDVGEARLQITNVPADVGCVRITVAGSRTVLRNFDVMVGQAATFALTGLPLGSVTFTAEAFMTACASVGAGDLGVWISDPVMATLVTSSVADVALVMHRNGRASVSVGFSDDADGGGAPDSGTPADMGTPPDTRDGPPPCQITDPNDLPDLSFVDSNCDGIDGTAANAIFVATTGSDMNAGTMLAPKRTIAAAITAAATATPIRNVYVAAGDYAETVVLTSGVSIFGGFNAATGWSRSLTTVTTISGGNPALRAENLTGLVEVQLFTVSGAPAMAPGDSGYGAFVVNSNVIFRRCTIRAGVGGSGLSGANGIAGSNGTPGSAGGVGQANGSGGGVGGPNGTSSCGALAGRGGLGGFDGPGQAGLPSSSGAAGGVGGAVSSMCAVRAANGLAGAAGPPGGNGGNGPVASPGSLLISGFVPGTGFAGTAGLPGSGGGGGGGGGGGRTTTILCNADRGGGGGGGGAGGCPGTAGQAGRGGGGSFAVFSFSSAVQLLDCTLIAATGGIGGRGGDAGTAGTAAAGASGGAGADDSGNGGPGGNGGPAGPSGAGSGGTGGASACVVFRGTGPMAPGLNCTRAPGAPGGPGGFSNLGTAAAGPVGPSQDILSL